ncbi:hypothetical protein V6N13_124132 [Hibiscus sabdariffa]
MVTFNSFEYEGFQQVQSSDGKDLDQSCNKTSAGVDLFGHWMLVENRRHWSGQDIRLENGGVATKTMLGGSSYAAFDDDKDV